MKKSLVALAALAVVGAASAQSSVTLYGVADVGLTDNNLAGSTAQMTSAGAMNNGNSRFGFKGTEDLGGGLKGNFNMEGGLTSETGAGNTSGGQLFSRAAWLEVAGGFGAVRMGRSLSPNFYGVAAWELTGTANYSIVGSQFGFSGNVRNSSQFSYTTPNISGFTASVGYVLKADNLAGAVAGGVNAAGTALVPAVAGTPSAIASGNLTYVAGPVAAGFAYSKTENTGTKDWSLGGKYNFGMFAVAASYHDPAGVKKGFTIGGTANVGAASLTLDLARDTGSAIKTTDLLLEGKYPLSKRTFAYAAVVRDDQAVGATVNSYALGLRHNF